MAKTIDPCKVFALGEGESLKVGHNRVVTKKGDTFACALHGHVVAWVVPLKEHPLCRVTLDDCGYLTSTTISAMCDFMRLFGVAGKASRAGGVLSVRYKRYGGVWCDKDKPKGTTLEFTAGRYEP